MRTAAPQSTHTLNEHQREISFQHVIPGFFFAVSKLEDGKSKLAPLDMNIYFEASAIKKANSSILLVRVNDDE